MRISKKSIDRYGRCRETRRANVARKHRIASKCAQVLFLLLLDSATAHVQFQRQSQYTPAATVAATAMQQTNSLHAPASACFGSKLRDSGILILAPAHGRIYPAQPCMMGVG